MPKIFNRIVQKSDILRYVGKLSNIIGASEYTLSGGRQHGVKIVEMYNDTGLRLRIMVDRGMDIANASFCGKPVSWDCKNGIVSPMCFENGGLGFLRSFAGGLVTTCGLTQAGDPCIDGDEVLGIHGRIDHIPAEKYAVEEYWDNDRYCVKFKGECIQSCLYKEYIKFTREIVIKSGETRIFINDSVINEGFNETPFMYMYHINFGYPIVSENTRLYTDAEKIYALNEAAKNGANEPCAFQKPTTGYEYECFVHEMPKDKYKVYAGLVNEEMDFGAYVAYNPRQMPTFNTWKMMGEQDYVAALEPGMNLPVGRVSAKESGALHFLKPGDRYCFDYEIGILNGKENIEIFKKELRG